MARVPANSYPPGPRKSSGSSGSSGGSSSRKGDKYLGGNTFLDRETGERYEVTGDYTSPSGKTSHIDSDGTVTTTGSRDKSQIGNTYRDGELIGGTSLEAVLALAERMAKTKGGGDIDEYLLRAMAEMGYTGELSDFESEEEQERPDENPLEKPAADAARAAYISYMLKRQNAEQDAVYTGNNRGLQQFRYQ